MLWGGMQQQVKKDQEQTNSALDERPPFSEGGTKV